MSKFFIIFLLSVGFFATGCDALKDAGSGTQHEVQQGIRDKARNTTNKAGDDVSENLRETIDGDNKDSEDDEKLDLE